MKAERRPLSKIIAPTAQRTPASRERGPGRKTGESRVSNHHHHHPLLSPTSLELSRLYLRHRHYLSLANRGKLMETILCCRRYGITRKETIHITKSVRALFHFLYLQAYNNPSNTVDFLDLNQLHQLNIDTVF